MTISFKEAFVDPDTDRSLSLDYLKSRELTNSPMYSTYYSILLLSLNVSILCNPPLRCSN